MTPDFRQPMPAADSNRWFGPWRVLGQQPQQDTATARVRGGAKADLGRDDAAHPGLAPDQQRERRDARNRVLRRVS